MFDHWKFIVFNMADHWKFIVFTFVYSRDRVVFRDMLHRTRFPRWGDFASRTGPVIVC